MKCKAILKMTCQYGSCMLLSVIFVAYLAIYVQESLLPWVHPGNFSLFFIGSIDAFVSVIPPSCVLLSVATLRSYQHISWFSGLSWKLIAVYIQCIHYHQICISFHSHNQVFILFITLLILFANAVIVACEVLKNSWVDKVMANCQA